MLRSKDLKFLILKQQPAIFKGIQYVIGSVRFWIRLPNGMDYYVLLFMPHC